MRIDQSCQCPMSVFCNRVMWPRMVLACSAGSAVHQIAYTLSAGREFWGVREVAVGSVQGKGRTNSRVLSASGWLIHHPPLLSGFQPHGHLHPAAPSGDLAENLCGQYPGASLLPLRQPSRLLQAEIQVTCLGWGQAAQVARRQGWHLPASLSDDISGLQLPSLGLSFLFCELRGLF